MSVQKDYIAMQHDFNRLWNAARNWGVISPETGSLAVSQKSGTPDMSVDVAVGWALFESMPKENESTTNVVLSAAHGSLPRKDIIVMSNAGVISKVDGTPETADPPGQTGPYTKAPAPPAIPSTSIILAEVYVAPGVTQIFDADITDRRAPIGQAFRWVDLPHPDPYDIPKKFVYWCTTHDQPEASNGNEGIPLW